MTYHVENSPYPNGQVVACGCLQGDPERGAVGNNHLPSTTTPARSNGKLKTPEPMIGGILATAGGLVFTGEGNGKFAAL